MAYRALRGMSAAGLNIRSDENAATMLEHGKVWSPELDRYVRVDGGDISEADALKVSRMQWGAKIKAANARKARKKHVET